jgi:hypothetical protein
MRTTLDLSEEAYHLAKAVALERNMSLGKVVSEFILQRRDSRFELPKQHSEAGFPIFASGKQRTSEDVRVLLDEEAGGRE